MSEFKGSPGPWEATRGTVSAENGSVFCIADCYMPSVGPNWSGTDYTGEQYQLANARLIAAAPELLEALEYALPYLEACVPNPRNGVNADYSVDVNCVDRARAAISKALGSQP